MKAEPNSRFPMGSTMKPRSTLAFALCALAAIIGCGQNSNAPAETAEQKNRRAVELTIGSVTDAEWQQARQESREPEQHVQASQILDRRFAQTQRELDAEAKRGTDEIERMNRDFQAKMAADAAETQKKLQAQLEEGKRRRAAEQAAAAAEQQKSVDQAKRELAALKKQQHDREGERLTAEIKEHNAAFAARLKEAQRTGASSAVFQQIEDEIAAYQKESDARVAKWRAEEIPEADQK
jgi:hypothetical protein